MKHIFIIDLDGTIIGDITPQIIMWELSKTRQTQKNIKFDNKGLKTKLQGGHIVRPGFVDFVNYIQGRGDLVYIYTASEKAWAHVIVSQIERAFGIKFERPIFTRQNCEFINNQYLKSTRYIQRGLIRSLRNKDISIPEIQKHITIIDNTNVWHSSDQQNLVVCPSYSYSHPENIACQISQDQFDNYVSLINSIMMKYIPDYNVPTQDYWSFQRRVSIFYINSIGIMKQTAAQVKQDRFFYQLMKILQGHPKHVFAKYIKRSLRVHP